MAQVNTWIGKSFGDWTVIAEGSKTGRFICKCSCGTVAERYIGNLRKGTCQGCHQCRKLRHPKVDRKCHKCLKILPLDVFTRTNSKSTYSNTCNNCKTKRNLKNAVHAGMVFNQWTVLDVPSISKNGSAQFLCRCTCGTEYRVSRSQLLSKRSGMCRSCQSKGNIKHGMSHSREYELWHGAKDRSNYGGLAFDLDPRDISIPLTCPILGIPLIHGKNKMTDNSPTLDKIEPSLGYTKNNIQVISWRANRLKSNSTREERLKLMQADERDKKFSRASV